MPDLVRAHVDQLEEPQAAAMELVKVINVALQTVRSFESRHQRERPSAPGRAHSRQVVRQHSLAVVDRPQDGREAIEVEREGLSGAGAVPAGSVRSVAVYMAVCRVAEEVADHDVDEAAAISIELVGSDTRHVGPAEAARMGCMSTNTACRWICSSGSDGLASSMSLSVMCGSAVM